PLRSQIIRHCQLVCVDTAKLQLCLSKTATYAFAEAQGVRVPKTWTPRDANALKLIAQDTTVPYPRVIKGAKEMGASVVVYVHSPDELERAFLDVCERYGFHDPADWPIVQEFVEGVGCGFFAVYDNGQCGPTFQHKRVRELPATGGFSVAA